jgi:hypothetical protein
LTVPACMCVGTNDIIDSAAGTPLALGMIGNERNGVPATLVACTPTCKRLALNGPHPYAEQNQAKDAVSHAPMPMRGVCARGACSYTKREKGYRAHECCVRAPGLATTTG